MGGGLLIREGGIGSLLLRGRKGGKEREGNGKGGEGISPRKSRCIK